jgi:ATP-dependent exoDNAse (exonuclease V) alpha subunit
MAPFAIVKKKTHPYAKRNSETHGHFDETPFQIPAFSAASVPFRWMLRREVEGDAEKGLRGKADLLKLDYDPEREPDLGWSTAWVQERENQLVLLDTFFGAIQPHESLCFLYAKRTPLSEDTRRVIVGIGRVTKIGVATEYRYTTKSPPLRGVLWERAVHHSIRPGFSDGFLFPYAELLEAAEKDTSLPLEECVAFAPDETFEQFSYATEHLPHDGAVASLLSCARALRRIRDVLPGDWDTLIRWVDRELNRLWEARGAFPGFGSALCAFGLQHGTLLAHEISVALAQEGADWTADPWKRFDELVDDPSRMPIAEEILGSTFRTKWRKLPTQRRELLKLLSRFALSAAQATRWFIPEEREAAGIEVGDDELLKNPYVVFEMDRHQEQPVSFDTVDRGLFPPEAIRKAFPVPKPSAVADAIDPRRVRAVVVATLEEAADTGHTLLPRKWVVERVRRRAMEPPCPLDEDTLAVASDEFAPLVHVVTLGDGGGGFQLDLYAETKAIIARAVKNRLKGARHAGAHDWAALVEKALPPLPQDKDELFLEKRARTEKTAALEELFASRFSVLVGPAGTGKTTLLKVLCSLPEVDNKGVLLLAPTGKARVRLEQAAGRRGEGKTLAQFLSALQRYDGKTGTYRSNAEGPKSAGHGTVIVDECSMLTEEQLAALFDALQGVDRVVLVGDPRQLPPIGAGRPFVDIVDELTPAGIETMFPRRGRGYTELTIPRRQQGTDREDLLLAAHFAGKPLEASADEVWEKLARGQVEGVRVVPWKTSAELQQKLMEELRAELRLSSLDDEAKFEESIGGSDYNGNMYFWPAREGKNPGAASKAESWQILSPVRAAQHGVDALNRAIQGRFRRRAREWALEETFYKRRVPRPAGPQGILWGDKVINLQNAGWRKTWPRQESAYVANGDIGIVTGEFKTQKFKGLPENVAVEFASLKGVEFKFWSSEFSSEDASPPLELAYALTVHKTQGSEFKTTFVVVPNPCRLLSRELLYTALTRHQERLIILPQGELRKMQDFAHEGASEIAARVTNLFREPAPVEVAVGRTNRFLEKRLIHRTERGELVRSKSELVIADKLHARKVDYVYEGDLVIEGRTLVPDFIIRNEDSGQVFYWEHLGMLDDPGYRRRWARKLETYKLGGILPVEDGGGPKGMLVTTRDEPGGALDSQRIAEIIERLLLGE